MRRGLALTNNTLTAVEGVRVGHGDMIGGSMEGLGRNFACTIAEISKPEAQVVRI